VCAGSIFHVVIVYLPCPEGRTASGGYLTTPNAFVRQAYAQIVALSTRHGVRYDGMDDDPNEPDD
jgi:hypothetical protein